MEDSGFILFKDLLLSLAAKDLKTRYKTTALGVLWILVQPLLMTLIFSVVFSGIFKVRVEKFPVFLLCGLLPWSFLQLSLTAALTSLVDQSHLIKKVPFPRMVIPASVVLSHFCNFLLSLFVLFFFLAAWRVPFGPVMLWLPIIVFIQFIFILGLALLGSVLYVRFRDLKYIVELGLLCLFYLTPIFYAPAMVPEALRGIFMMNPMAGLITLYREILLSANGVSIPILVYSFSVSLFFFGIGFLVFIKNEPTLADFV